MGGGGPTTSYTYSTQTSLPQPSRVWFVIDPGGVTNSTTYPVSNTGSVTLKIYVQSTKPTASDTPWHSEAVSATSFDSIGIIWRTSDMYWDKLEWTLEDYWTFNPADTGFRYAPVLHDTGSNDEPAGSISYVPTGVPYLGTDKVYEVGETT